VNPLKFTGQYQDPSSQYHLRARQYIPSIGRFTQTDPMPYGPGSSFEGSYVYAGARPSVMTDPGGKRFGLGGAQLSGFGNPLKGLCWAFGSKPKRDGSQCVSFLDQIRGKKPKSPLRAPKLAYDPKFWNNDSIRNSNNCYSYAINRPYISQIDGVNDGKPQPGEYAGKPWYGSDGKGSLDCQTIEQAVLADGLTRSTTSKCAAGSHRAVLVIAPEKDYHWYREDVQGSWSHKRGNLPVSDVDASGQKISDPETANRNYGVSNYSVTCGTFCAAN
jgi:RHS repeat-associated protein